ncbi:uncharacterized protein LOC128174485 [Crassostrea angulata]|uniref:uncharacterized protein LOC128174485 n=1 Tax=Magallana angulata TaxID=2784310 RepID=UPI0022B0F704|nr:uncharacterized protein LOC128174485 [Crassostrea angulata]
MGTRIPLSDESSDSYLTDYSETSDGSDWDYQQRSSYPNSYPEVNNIIHKMWDTVLDHIHGYQQKLASTTYLVCKTDAFHKPAIIKSNAEHAEEQLLSKIQSISKVPLKIIIYINNSPCAKCASLLKQFLLDNQHIQMVLYNAHLYNIQRISCKSRKAAKKNEKHVTKISNEDHVKNYNGLRDLMSLGGHQCRIEAFTKKVWKDLLDVTGISRQMMSNYNRRKRGCDRSRKNEDKRIKKDLNEIKRFSIP